MRVALLNNSRKQCGVHQMGESVYGAMLSHSKHVVEHVLVGSREEFLALAGRLGEFDVVLFNYHASTMPWVERLLVDGKSFLAACINHEFDWKTLYTTNAELFDYRLAFDPSMASCCPNVAVIGRIVPEMAIETTRNEVFTIGSFGFATGGKKFDKLVEIARQYDGPCRLRLHIPFAHYGDASGDAARAYAGECARLAESRGLAIEVSHEFLGADALVAWLAANDLNVFLYDEQQGRGVSSVLDWALAAGRPIALSDTTMFRHVRTFAPELFLARNDVDGVVHVGLRSVLRLRELWAPEKAARQIDLALERFVADRGSRRTARQNTVLDDGLRAWYQPEIEEIARLCPEVHGRKIPRANVQQAFVKASIERHATQRSRILCVGCNEDSAYLALREKGFSIDAIDPLFNVDLEGFYARWDHISRYDVVFATSVIEHVADDVLFMRRVVDLLRPGGHAIMTMDFKQGYGAGECKPGGNERLYDSAGVARRLFPAMLGCELVDCYDWNKYPDDFSYDGIDYCFATLVFRKRRLGEDVASEVTVPQATLVDGRLEVVAATSAMSECDGALRELRGQHESLKRVHEIAVLEGERLERERVELVRQQEVVRQLEASRSWRVALLLQRLAVRVMPRGSWRRRVGRWCWRCTRPVIRCCARALKL